jgi:hypothetical protein
MAEKTMKKYLLLNPDDRVCSLQGYKVPCFGALQHGHIIHKGQARGNKDGRAILAACPPIIMAWQCEAHNVGRWANQREAIRIQLLQKIYEYGYEAIDRWFDEFLATFKVRPHDLELRSILG